MTNEKDLVYPTTIVEVDNIDGTTIRNIEHFGLTKLEYFAGLAMQGNISTMNSNMLSDESILTIANESVRLAKALIEELNKTI